MPGLRPPRADIAAPPFEPGLEWLGGPAPRLERAVAEGPLLVHFWDFAQLNCIRALPYLSAWHRRYAAHGLGLLGIHSPRFPFTRAAAAVAAALPRLEIEWPVAVDAKFAVWRAYGCEGWPSLFLWSRGGALRWYHLGEGAYEATEDAIREELGDAPAGGWPPPLEALRPGDAEGARVVPPTPELVPGGSLETPWVPSGGDTAIEVSYEGAAAYAAADGDGELAVSLDRGDSTRIEIAHPGLYELAVGELSRSCELRLEASGSVAVHSIQFAPGPPARP